MVYLSGLTIMRPYLDVFWTVIVLLETGTSGGEAADGRLSVVGWIDVKMPGREVHEGGGCCVGSRLHFGGESAAKC